jgi:hypothetical protein
MLVAVGVVLVGTVVVLWRRLRRDQVNEINRLQRLRDLIGPR